MPLSVSGFLWVAWVQLDYIRNNFFFQFKMSHGALCSPRSVHSFIVLSEDEGHNIRTLMFLTGLANLGRRWTKRARTAKWHDSCWGRTLDGGSYTPKRSRAYNRPQSGDGEVEKPQLKSLLKSKVSGGKYSHVIILSPFVTSNLSD